MTHDCFVFLIDRSPQKFNSLFLSFFNNMDVESFLSLNEEKYKTIAIFQTFLNNITEETFPSIIQYIEDRKKFFFKDRESSIIFLSNIANFSIYNFQQFSLIQDVFIHFSNEIKSNGIDELDLIDFNIDMLCSLNYLYDKNMITVESLYQKSIFNDPLFINFFNEIDDYDHEYATTRADEILNDVDHNRYDEEDISFLNHVIQNLEEHRKNRNLNYHSSLFHKAIRDDDIDTFQSILSKNNFSINYKFERSYYERALTEDFNPSLIQVAAVYGSLKIFKFLWMQPSIEISENLIDYAVSGRNFEIIHICENKCPSLRRALVFSIASHQNELSEYIIENTEINKEEDNDNDNDNIYNSLSYVELKFALEFMNYKIVIPCLKKIVAIVHKNDKEKSFFTAQFYDIELFKFLYSNRNPNLNFFDGTNPAYFMWLANRMFDVIKYLIQFFNPSQLYQLFEDSIRFDPKVACLLMDLQFDEIENKEEHPIYDAFKKIIGASDYFIIYAADYFDVNVMTKLLNLYYVIDNPNIFTDIFSSLSTKMLNSLFQNKLTFSSIEKVYETSAFLKENGMNEAAELVLKYNQ